MANNVIIGGQTVDADDPCALAKALTAVKLRVTTGESLSDMWIQDFHGQRRTRWNPPNLAALEAEIARQQDLCRQSNGGRKARFAMRAGFRRIP